MIDGNVLFNLKYTLLTKLKVVRYLFVTEGSHEQN